MSCTYHTKFLLAIMIPQGMQIKTINVSSVHIHVEQNVLPVSCLSMTCKSVCVLKQKKPNTLDLNHLGEWELPKEEFTLEEELGSGYFADVYRGRWKNHINVAIKILKSGN